MTKQRNAEVLKSFVEFCEGPGKEMSFWEALRQWAGVRYIMVSHGDGMLDNTNNWKGRNG